jgi:ubiquinone/menaquinone biosynthesis C-methylase UbiE
VSRSLARHPLFARFYARVSPSMERVGARDHRHALLADLNGSVIDVGAGTGANFAHFPPTVDRVLAVEPEAHLRQIARRTADDAPVPVEVVDGVAEDLPADDETFDAAVTFLVLCSVADPHVALCEIHRVLKPGGQLRFFEHVRADAAGLRRGQRLADATLWPRLNGGCRTSRDTAAAIARAGFEIRQLDHLRFPPTRITLPSSPHIAGTAVRR